MKSGIIDFISDRRNMLSVIFSLEFSHNGHILQNRYYNNSGLGMSQRKTSKYINMFQSCKKRGQLENLRNHRFFQAEKFQAIFVARRKINTYA